MSNINRLNSSVFSSLPAPLKAYPSRSNIDCIDSDDDNDDFVIGWHGDNDNSFDLDDMMSGDTDKEYSRTSYSASRKNSMSISADNNTNESSLIRETITIDHRKKLIAVETITATREKQNETSLKVSNNSSFNLISLPDLDKQHQLNRINNDRNWSTAPSEMTISTKPKESTNDKVKPSEFLNPVALPASPTASPLCSPSTSQLHEPMTPITPLPATNSIELPNNENNLSRQSSNETHIISTVGEIPTPISSCTMNIDATALLPAVVVAPVLSVTLTPPPIRSIKSVPANPRKLFAGQRTKNLILSMGSNIGAREFQKQGKDLFDANAAAFNVSRHAFLCGLRDAAGDMGSEWLRNRTTEEWADMEEYGIATRTNH